MTVRIAFWHFVRVPQRVPIKIVYGTILELSMTRFGQIRFTNFDTYHCRAPVLNCERLTGKS